MAILIGLLRGTSIAAAIMLAFALLKKLIIVFGFLFAILKFAIVILFLVLLIFGASRLPEIGRGIGKGIRNFKEATREGARDDKSS